MTILKRHTSKLWQYLKKNLNPIKVIFIVLLVFIPLYPKFPFMGVIGTYVAIRIEDFLVLGAILIWGLIQFRQGLPILKEKILILFGLYWLVGIISLVSALLISDLIEPKIAFLHFFRRIEYMSLFFIAYEAMKNISFWEPLITILVTSTLVFAYGIGQKYFGLPVVSTMNEEFSKGILLYLDQWTRISSTFAGHYDLAVWVSFLLSLFPALIILAKRNWQKFLLFICFGLNFYLLILTASRVSFAAYLIGISITTIFLKKIFWLPLILGISLFFGFSSKELNARLQDVVQPVAIRVEQIGLSQQSAFLKQTVSDKLLKPMPYQPSPTPTLIPTTPSPKKTPVPDKLIAPEASPTPVLTTITREIRTWPTPEEAKVAAARSSRIRFEIEWPRAARAFLKNPLLGTGFSSLGLATDNDYLRILGETGILGFLTFSLIIIFLIRKVGETIKWGDGDRKIITIGLLGGLVSFLANAIFIDVFEASKVAFYFWLWMGIMFRINSKLKT